MRAMLPAHLSGGSLSFRTARSMMRWLAWWKTKRSTSSGLSPARSSTWVTQRGRASTAKRNTACPSIRMTLASPVPTPGTHRVSGRARQPMTAQRSGKSSPHSTTAAPAPSPKRTQVDRSSRSVTRVSTSAPSTRPYRRPFTGSSRDAVWTA